MQLHSYQEVIGILHAVEQENKYYKLKLTCTKEIEIPPTEILQEKLYCFLDKKIGIFNNNGDYKFRIIQDRKSKKIMHENRCRKPYNTTVQSAI